MNYQVLQRTKVKVSRQWLRLVLLLASCIIVVSFLMIASSVGQSIVAAPQEKSIISLAPSPRPPAQMVARRSTDSRFENAPANYHVFPAVAVGEFSGAEVLTLNFAAETTVTRIKSRNKDFAIEPGGTCLEGVSYTRGESCSLLVRFKPQGPGHRLGFVSITSSAAATPTSLGLTGNGYAPVISFVPAQITTVPGTFSAGAGTLSGVTNMAIDGGDILYIADIGHNQIKEIDSSGVINTIAPAFATPASLVADSFGIVYSLNLPGSTYYFSTYAPWGVQTAYGYSYASATCTVAAPCAFSAVGMSNPGSVSIDAYDNLFFAEGTTGAAEMPVAGMSQGGGTLNLWHLKDQYSYFTSTPGPFAVDANGNLYNYYTYAPSSLCYLVEESLYQAEYAPSATRVAGGIKCGFSGDGSQASGAEISASVGQIAFDIAGDLYFADSGNQRVRRIEAATGIIRTVAGNGTAGYTGDNGPATAATLASPTGVGVDSRGQVYVISSTTAGGAQQVIRKLGINGALTFSSTSTGKASAAQAVTISNTGNVTLTFHQPGLMIGTNINDFLIDPITTTCDFSAGNALGSGQSCQIGIIFKPSAIGARAATLKLFDNTVSNANYVSLKGTAVAAAVVKITAPAANAQLKTGTVSNFSVGVTSTLAAQPTGTVTFKADGKQIGAPVAIVSGAASTKLGALSTGAHTLTAMYSGDAKHAAATATETITVQ